MATISNYENNLQQALIDAATEPSLQQFIEPSDVETMLVDLGDGTQAEVQALSSAAVRKFIERILAKARQAGIDIKSWICSKAEFDLCQKLSETSVGEVMRQLDEFLRNKWAQGGIATTGLITLFTLPALGAALAIFSAVGFLNNVFIDLCECAISA